MPEDTYIYVVNVADVPAKSMASFDVNGNSVLICHTPEGLFAVENQCSHAMATLEAGRLRGCRLVCPLHGASFDVRDGSVKGKPALQPIRSYPLRVVDGRIEISIV